MAARKVIKDRVDLLIHENPISYTKLGKALGITPYGFRKAKEAGFDPERAKLIEDIFRRYGQALAEFTMPTALIRERPPKKGRPFSRFRHKAS